MSADRKKKFEKHVLDQNYDPRNVSQRSRNICKEKMEESREKFKLRECEQDDGASSSFSAPGPSNRPEFKPFWTELQKNVSENDIVDLTKEWISFNTRENRDDDWFGEETPFSEEEILLSQEDSLAEDIVDEVKTNADNLNNRNRHPSFSSFVDFNNKIMFRESGLLLNDVIEMVMAFSISFVLTLEGRNYLIEMLKLCAGPEFKYLQITDYLLRKQYNPPVDKIKYFFYCGICEKKVLCSSTKTEIKDMPKTCSNCEEETTLSLSCKTFFSSIDCKYQMEILLHNKKIRDSMVQLLESEPGIECDTDSTIMEIHDGRLFKQVKKLHSKTCMYIISTDGAPLPSGTKQGFWPLQIVLIFVDSKTRYKIVLLVGLMVLDHEPKPDLLNLFISAFNEQAQLLHTEGISFAVLDENGVRKEYNFTLTPLIVVADSVARPVLQNRVQYNGYYGCSYCYQYGMHCKSMKYPFVETDPELRSHVSHMMDVLHAEEKKSIVRGVKGRSAFCDMSNLDLVWSFVLDAMHNGILGMTV